MDGMTNVTGGLASGMGLQVYVRSDAARVKHVVVK